ncbi:MAG: PAS domain S-box protein [Owenweeksia sp.]|nr:PAS domain S-box protein [Owenweeksia sp.]
MNIRRFGILLATYILLTIGLAVAVHLLIGHSQEKLPAKSRLIEDAGTQSSQLTLLTTLMQDAASSSAQSAADCDQLEETWQKLSARHTNLQEYLPQIQQAETRQALQTNIARFSTGLNRLQAQLKLVRAYCAGEGINQDRARQAALEASTLATGLQKLSDINTGLLRSSLKTDLTANQLYYNLLIFGSVSLFVLLSVSLGWALIRSHKAQRLFNKEVQDKQRLLNARVKKSEGDLKNAHSELQQYLLALEESEAYLKGFIEHSGFAIWSVDRKGVLQKGNEHFRYDYQELFKEEPQEGRTNLVESFQSIEDQHWSAYFEQALAGENGYFKIPSNGRMLEVNLNPLRNATGHIIGAAGFFLDVTERVKSDEAIKLSQERLKLSLENSHQGMFDWNLHSDELVINETFTQLHGYNRGEVDDLHQFWQEHINADYRSSFEALLSKARHSKEGAPIEFDYQSKDKKGNLLWLRLKARIMGEMKRPTIACWAPLPTSLTRKITS